MVVILAFSAFSALSGVARSLNELMLIRAMFGFAMGGEWGIGASLMMETIPPRLRGPVSGLLQSGYPSGYFLASLVYACCSIASAGAACSSSASPRHYWSS